MDTVKQLTDEQVENWRRALYLQFGAYAMIMPKEQIQAYHDKMQAHLAPAPSGAQESEE